MPHTSCDTPQKEPHNHTSQIPAQTHTTATEDEGQLVTNAFLTNPHVQKLQALFEFEFNPKHISKKPH